MKKIEGVFDDGAKRAKLALAIMGVAFLSVVFGVIPSDGMVAFVVVGFLLFIGSFIILFMPGIYKTTLLLDVLDTSCVLNIDYSGKKYELKNPIKYDVCILPVMQNQYQSKMYFRMVFHDSTDMKHTFYEKIENEVPDVKGVKLLSNSEKWLIGINSNKRQFPSTLWQIYQELEKHPECKNIGKTERVESSSPFEVE